MQVDWISGIITSRMAKEAGVEVFDTGSILRLDPESGSLEKLRSDFQAPEGSFDHRMIVQAMRPFELYLSGNPVKFLQGHNLFGSTDVVGLFFDAGHYIRRHVGFFPGPESFQGLDCEGPRLTRVDLTRSYRFPSDAAARAWLRSVAAFARSRHGSATMEEGTVYFGQKSRRWSLKVYLKSDELLARGKGHRLSLKLSEHACEQLREWATGVVRFEVTIRGLELAENPLLHERVLSSQPAQLLEVWSEYYRTIVFNRNVAASEADMSEETLSAQRRMQLAAWRQGLDLRAMLSRNAFYTLRREILRQVGVDVAQPAPAPVRSVVQADLDPVGWDPEPIETLTHHPDEDRKRQYGLV